LTGDVMCHKIRVGRYSKHEQRIDLENLPKCLGEFYPLGRNNNGKSSRQKGG